MGRRLLHKRLSSVIPSSDFALSLKTLVSSDFTIASRSYRNQTKDRLQGGASILTYTRRAHFQGIVFQPKFLNRVKDLLENSKTGYDYPFKNNKLLFPVVFWKFNSKQDIEMPMFFLNRLWKILRKWASSRHVTFGGWREGERCFRLECNDLELR